MACPKITEMQVNAEKGDVLLKKYLTSKHVLLYPLLCWIVTSNRAHLRQLTKAEQISCFGREGKG